MRKLLRFALAALVSLSVLTAQNATAQSYPFPVNFEYSQGLMPENRNDADVQAAYNDWKANYVTSSGACGDRRVIFDYYPGTTRGASDRSLTVSEGIGYGMLIAAYMGDQSLLDDLWSYYKRNSNGNGVMHWRIKNSCQVTGSNGASDAELDVAMALIIASHQFQSDAYANDARTMIRTIREKEFEGTILKPGDQFGGSNLVCPSYFSPAYYRVFKEYDAGQDAFWDAAADKGYEIIEAVGGTSGLVPDWCNASGGVSGDASQYEDQGKNFIFDAIRTPFRSGIDYLWHGDPKALAYCTKLSTWLTNDHNSAWDIGSKYGTALNGNERAKISPYINNTFVGCFSVGLMGTEMTAKQAWLNTAYEANTQTEPGQGEYFNASFKLLSLMVMTGNFYLPPPDACDAPALGDDRSLCEGSPITLNANVTNRTYVWKKNGGIISGATSASYSVTSAGVYEVLATENGTGCVRRDKVTVDAAAIIPDFIAKSGPGNVTLTDNTSGGVSNYSYTVTGGTYTGEEVSTDATYILDNLAQGAYDITLTVNNSGFGCTDEESITKKVVVGDGVGLAVDDFAKANEVAIYAYNLGTSVTPVEKDYCSTQDMLDNKPKVCPVYPCGQLEIECLGAPANKWDGFGVGWKDAADGALNLTEVAFLSIRMKATSAVEVGLKFQMGDISCDAQAVDVTTEYQIFNIDFSEVKNGWDNAAEASTEIAAWNAVDAIQILPYNDDVTWTGTVTVDWFIVGAQSIAPPTFATKLDENGFTDYGNYLPDYYPYDPQYSDCTIETEGDACYGDVPDWDRYVTMCTDEVELVANSCTAENIKWFKDGVEVGQGPSFTATGEGKYIIELSNQGGTYRDSVIVSQGGQPTASFNYTVEDQGYGIRTFNNSEGFDTWKWDYGVIVTDESETWEDGYHNYDEEGSIEICLTVNDTVCGNTDKDCQTIEIKCYAPLGAVVGLPTEEVEACPGQTLSYTIQDVENASSYGWFGWTETALAEDVTEVSFDVEVPFWLKVEAYNQCGEKVLDSVYINSGVKPEITWDTFEADGYYGSFGHSTTGYPTPGTEDFTWTIDGDVQADFQDEYAMSYVFAAEGDYEICLEAGYDCAVTSGVVKSCDIVTIVCPLPEVPVYSQSNEQLAYTFTNTTNEVDVEYTWLVDGSEETAETDGSLVYTFASEGDYEVCLIAGNECVLPGTDAPQNCKTITASLLCTETPSLDLALSTTGDDFSRNVTTTLTNVESPVYTVDGDSYTPTSEPFELTFDTEGAHEVCVSATATGIGCSNPGEVCKSVTITNTCVDPLVTFSTSEDNGVVTVTTTSNATSFAWTATGSVEGTSTDKSPVFTYEADGDYTISVIASAECGATKEATNPVSVAICNEIVVDFSASYDGLDVTITNNTTNATTYTWSTDEASNVSTLENPVITFTDFGDHTITLAANSDCDAAQKIIDVSLTGGVCTAPVADFTWTDNNNQKASVTSTSTDPDDLALTYEWSAIGMYFTDETAATTVANPNIVPTVETSYNVVLKVTNTCGASDTYTESVTLSVATPECESPATAAFTTSESNGVVMITNSSVNAATYAWTATGATPASSTVENPTFTYATSGDYDIKLIVTSTDDLCDDATVTESVTVTIQEGCTTPATASFTTTENNGTVTVSNTSTNADSYAWTATGATPASSTVENPTFTYTASGDYSIKLVVSNADGLCLENEVTKPVTVLIEEGCTTPVSASFTTTEDEGVVTVSNTSTNADSYAWTATGATPASSSDENPTFTYTANGTYSIVLMASNADDKCSDDETSKSVTVSSIVDCSPIDASFTTNVNGFTINTTNTSSGPYEKSSWTVNTDEQSSPLTNPSFIVNGAGSYEVCLTVEAQDGCSDIVAPVCKTVTIADPNCNGTSPDLGEDASLCDEPVMSIGTDVNERTIKWFSLVGETLTRLPYDTETLKQGAGTYVVELSSTDGCTYSDTMTIYGSSVVYAGFNGSIVNNTGVFTANSKGATKYTWEIDGVFESNATTFTKAFTNSSLVEVCLTVENACNPAGTDTKCNEFDPSVNAEISVDPTALSELLAEGLINIYPNPVTDNLTIEVAEELNEVTVVVFNLLGQEVLSTVLTETTSVDVSELPNGTYIATIVSDNGFATVTLTKE